MNKLVYLLVLPVMAALVGFSSPEIDLESNVREPEHRKFAERQQKGRELLRRFSRGKYSGRLAAQYYVTSWFVVSFSLDLDDNTLVRTKDVFAKAISDIGNITKGEDKPEDLGSIRQIYSIFHKELKQTLGPEQYEIFKKMTEIRTRWGRIRKDQT